MDGEYIHILGCSSGVINVGGQKVYPVLENVIEQMGNVEDVIVTEETSSVTGYIVKATIKLNNDEDLMIFRKRMLAFCKNKLELCEVPQKIIFVKEITHGERFKKMRKSF